MIKREEIRLPIEYTLIKQVDACFTGKLQLELD